MYCFTLLNRTVAVFVFLYPGLAICSGTQQLHNAGTPEGRGIYDYYCYQCHGYTGNARTIASRYLNPKPRDFTHTRPQQLSRTAMLDAVRNGRPGTAMVGFNKVLGLDEIRAVVDYIRDYLMTGKPLTRRYHSGANSWPDHDRFSNAFAFIDGTLSLDTPWENLTTKQKLGRQIYLSACISCHDEQADRNDPVWELRVVSYPPMRYTHESDKSVPAPTLHPRHEAAPSAEGLSTEHIQGRRLFLDNCAHCHARDGSAQNWVGAFIEPHSRDFKKDDIITGSTLDALRSTISQGIPGTSMPAWRDVLSVAQIDAIIGYLRQKFRRRGALASHRIMPAQSSATRTRPPTPMWRPLSGKK